MIVHSFHNYLWDTFFVPAFMELTLCPAILNPMEQHQE